LNLPRLEIVAVNLRTEERETLSAPLGLQGEITEETVLRIAVFGSRLWASGWDRSEIDIKSCEAKGL
jgi:hypothetical protein